MQYFRRAISASLLKYLLYIVGIFVFGFTFSSPVYAQDDRDNPRLPADANAQVQAAQTNIRTSPFNPPKDNDTTFIVDDSPGLDTGCSFRSDGPLVFEIKVDRFIGDKNKLLANGLLKQTASLAMPAFDVDFAGASGVNPERDRVTFNGKVVPTEFLGGQNNTWILNNFRIPVEWIEFPSDPGTGNSVTPKVNTIRIDIDTANSDEVWCTSIDWATLTIDVARPILMVHGIFSDGGTWNQAGKFMWTPALNNLGIPNDTISMHTGSSLGLDSIQDNASDIATKVNQLLKRWGVERINIVAHSKGGIDSRHYIENNPTVEKLVQLGTPNAGSPLANLAQAGAVVLTGVIPTTVFNGLAAPAGYQLTTFHMNSYNQYHGANSKTRYFSLAGDYRFGGFGIIDALLSAIMGGRSDTVVPVSSVFALNYATKLTHPSSGSDKSAQHTSLTTTSSVYNRVEPFFKTLGQPTPALLTAASVEQAAATSLQTHTIADTVGQGATKSHVTVVDSTQPVSFILQHGQGNLNLTLITPSGQRITPDVAADPNIDFEELNDLPGLLLEAYAITNPAVGQWTLEVLGATVTNPAGIEPYVLTAIFTNSPIQLQTDLNKAAYHKNEPVVINATLTNNSAPITGATVMAKIVKPDDSAETVTLVDNGTGDDTAANDGIYTARFNNTAQAGIYNILVNATKAASPAFIRNALQPAFVSISNSQFNNTYSDFGNDTDGDGLFDELVINVGINVSDAATYQLYGELKDKNGVLITTASLVTTLAAGTQTVGLPFDGAQIFQHGVNGPYTLSIVRLGEDDGFTILPLDEKQNAHVTSAYNFTQFQGSSIVVPGTGSDQGIDTSGNGLFDLLTVNLDVLVANAGFYQWSGRLTDVNGKELGLASGSGSFNAGANTMLMEFAGEPIGKNGVNGPYLVKDLLIFGAGESAVVLDAYTTSALRANQFEGNQPPAPACVQFSINLDGRKEVPANPSTARGAASVRVNTTTNTLTYYISYTGLSSRETGAHIHGFAAAGSNAGVLHTLPFGPSKSGTWTYAEAQEANILTGLTYLNIHSQRYPNGEIRGQIANGRDCTATALAAEVPSIDQEEAKETIFLPLITR